MFLAFMLNSSQIIAQDGITAEGEAFAKDQIVYWFYIKLATKKHPQTKIERYDVYPLSNQVQAGTLAEYDVKLWKFLSKGSKLAIGPFEDYYEAEEALSFYNIKDTTGIDTSIDQSNKIHYFALEVYIRKRSNSYGIKRIPATVMPGTYSSFDYFLRFSLTSKKLAIGPFRNAMVAEEAKRRYRLH